MTCTHRPYQHALFQRVSPNRRMSHSIESYVNLYKNRRVFLVMLPTIGTFTQQIAVAEPAEYDKFAGGYPTHLQSIGDPPEN